MAWIEWLDRGMAEFVHMLLEMAGGFFTPVFKVITLSGNFGIVFLLISFILLIFRKTRNAAFLSFCSMAVGFVLTNLLLKNIVARPRPFVDTDSVFYGYWLQAGSLFENGYSFPSGHTTIVAAFSTGIFFSFPKRYSWPSILIPFVMGFSRIYFAVHFASDVLDGLLVGIIAGLLGLLVMRLLSRTSFFSSHLYMK